MSFRVFPRWALTVLGLGASLGLAGCGAGGTTSGGPTSSTGQSAGSPSSNPGSDIVLTGLVHSGHQLISGASVVLYVAGTSGYGNGAAALISNAATTGADGKFTIAGTFTCPSSETQTYVIAKGGDAGGGNNNSTVLMAAAGSCSTLGHDALVDVSEISSVASAYALAPFMQSGSTGVGTSSTNLVGLTNAFSTVANLIDPSTGAARATTPAGNGIVPQTRINALANIMGACVVTKGDGACPQFFSLATPPGGTAPGDTLSAILDIALFPGNNVSQLAALANSAPTFQPALTGAPSDWTLSVEYTGGGLDLPQLLAIDGSGDIWVPNAVDPGTLSEFSPIGQPLSGKDGFSGGGLSYPEAVAVDLSGNIWSANEGLLHGVSKHTSSGTPLSGTAGYLSASLIQPVAIALDAAGNVFTANFGNASVTKLNVAGASIAQITNAGLDSPYAVAVDTGQNVWIANSGLSNTVSKFSNTGTPANVAGYAGGGISRPYGIAIDATGNAWIANDNSSSASKLTNTGTPLSGGGYATPAPVVAVAVDGNNTVWTANKDGSISHLSASGASLSPSTGYISAGATGEVGIALDASGNVWTTDNYVDSIFEYVGAAAPTVTPLQQAVKDKTMGQRP